MKYVFISSTVCAWVIFALGAIAGELPVCAPKKSDFVGEDIKTYTVGWDINRSPGLGGANQAGNYFLPDPDGTAIVEWEAIQTSCINCVGEPSSPEILSQTIGILSHPAGVRVGTRLDTGGNPFGAGGSYTGIITMSYVSYEKWKDVFIAKYLGCS